MGSESVRVSPVLEEYESVLILDVAMDGMEETARLQSRSVDVLEAQLEHSRQVLALRLDAASDDEHRRKLPSGQSWLTVHSTEHAANSRPEIWQAIARLSVRAVESAALRTEIR